MSGTEHKREVNWLIVVFNLQVGLSCLLCLNFLFEIYFATLLFGSLMLFFGILGATAGAHRLWAHRQYKASLFLRIFLMLCQTQLGYVSIYDWVRLHRLHHKHHHTDLDPFNTKRGFIYAHFVANNAKLSQAQQKALEEIDMSDLEQDKVVMFQKKLYWGLVVILTMLLPVNAPVEYWNETMLNAVFALGWLRLGLGYHITSLIYSGAPLIDLSFGSSLKKAAESNLVYFFTKSYWISYHYLVPDDVLSGEFGAYEHDCTSKFIKVCAALGWAEKLKTIDGASLRDAIAVSMETKQPIAICLQSAQPPKALKSLVSC